MELLSSYFIVVVAACSGHYGCAAQKLEVLLECLNFLISRPEEKERVVKRDERYPVLGVGPDPNGSFNVENFAFGKRFLPFNKKEIKLLLTKVTSFIHDITTTSAASIIIS
ncbi:hypothetical protein T09_14205 [Trichinella sp. T9]|nr:hypothetical protein T09_14205 [Trichinella sp. T9]